jgi:hypothetical protein
VCWCLCSKTLKPLDRTDRQRRLLISARIEMMTRNAAPLGATQASLAKTTGINNGCIICLSFF